MSVTIQDMTSQVRLESGLRANQVMTDPQIQSLLGEAYLDLRDRLIVRFSYWFRKEVTFTLGGGADYVFDLSSLPDFQMAQGLDLVLGDSSYMTVPMLGSYQERNAYNSAWPFAGQGGYTGNLGRRYFVDGDNLEVLPAVNAGGTYRLVYTPIQTMQAPVTLSFTTSGSDEAFDSGGMLGVDIAGLSFDPAMIGGTAVVTWTNPANSAFQGTFTIGDTPTGAHYLVTTTPYPGGAFTLPGTGLTTVSYQPAGTVSVLPDKLTPWSQYMVLYAAIAVRNSREQDSSALMARFADIKDRVIALTKQRSEGTRQAPITRNRYGGPGWGGFGGM